jgi:hypothetical protein
VFWIFKWEASLYNSSFNDSPNNGAEDEDKDYRPSGCDDEVKMATALGKITAGVNVRSKI